MGRASVSVRTVRTRRRGKKWSPVLVEISPQAVTVQASQTHTGSLIICANQTNTTQAPTATVIKCGNFKISFECESTTGRTAPVTGTMFMMFVPQGIAPDGDYPVQHPEYIMAWRAFNPTGAVAAVTIQSRLKRNLNSGDRIMAIYKVRNDEQGPVTYAIRGTVTYVCCNN